MADQYYFDEKSTKRIAAGIRKIEKVNAQNQPRGIGTYSAGFFLAKITGRAGKKYSWEQVIFKDGDDVTDSMASNLKGLASDDNFAYDFYGSVDIPKNSIVRMFPSHTAPSYVFEYCGAVIIKSVGAIDAMVDDTPSSNTAQVWQENEDGVLVNVDTINVYNMAGDFGPNKFGQAKYIMGKFYLDVETC